MVKALRRLRGFGHLMRVMSRHPEWPDDKALAEVDKIMGTTEW